jgi:hypothetical protein
MEYSGGGKATARVRPVDAGAGASDSGCETEDFAGFAEGDIASSGGAPAPSTGRQATPRTLGRLQP